MQYLDPNINPEFKKVLELEKKYAHLESTFEDHDDWVNFINSKI